MTRDKIDKLLIDYLPQLKNYSMFLCRDNDLSQELIQEAAIRIIENADKFSEGTNFKAWAATITFRIFIDLWKSKHKRYLEDVSACLTIASNVGEPMEYSEITNSLDNLPTYLKKPILMWVSGFQYNEIALKLNLPLGTVKSRIFHARKKLSGELGEFI